LLGDPHPAREFGLGESGGLALFRQISAGGADVFVGPEIATGWADGGRRFADLLDYGNGSEAVLVAVVLNLQEKAGSGWGG
jgi:hypothetical protein